MSALPARAQALPPDPSPELLVSRQAVVDADMRVCGYRVAYAAPGGTPRVSAERSALRLFGDVLTVVGLEQLVGTAVAHLPLSRELLLTLGVPPVGPDRVILHLDARTAADPRLRQLLASLTARGYALAVRADPGGPLDLDTLALCGIVELEPAAWSEPDLVRIVSWIHAGRAVPLAAGLARHPEFDRARELGFERFSGAFIASPRNAAARSVPVGQLTALAALARLSARSAEIEELESLIHRDLGLNLRLLQYINSAYFGMRSKVTSTRQAVMMLGTRGVSRWAMLVSLTGAPDAPRELSLMALTRARMCELLGRRRPGPDAEELFTVGMLSAADALLGMQLEQIVERLPLADQVVEALLRRRGPAGAVLDVVLSYERGDFARIGDASTRRDAARAYPDALRWAEGVLETAG